MIRKTENGWVMDKVWQKRFPVKHQLDESAYLLLRVDCGDTSLQHCGNCGILGTPDFISIWAYSPADKNKKFDVWICDTCSEQWAPALSAEALRKRAELCKENELAEHLYSDLRFFMRLPRQQTNLLQDFFGDDVCIDWVKTVERMREILIKAINILDYKKLRIISKLLLEIAEHPLHKETVDEL